MFLFDKSQSGLGNVNVGLLKVLLKVLCKDGLYQSHTCRVSAVMSACIASSVSAEDETINQELKMIFSDYQENENALKLGSSMWCCLLT